MIKVRELRPDDMDEVRELSKRHFSTLEVPDFMNGYYCAYTVTDENNEIIIAGGLRPSAEILQVTDLTKGEMKIGRALIESQKAALYIGSKFNLNELLVFVQNNDKYARHLVRHGFYPRSNALAIQVPKWDSHNAIKT